MKQGIYHVKFSSSLGALGEGLAVFKDGKVNGGDFGYLYLGSYQTETTTISAQLKIKRWNSQATSILGNLNEFDLVLTGSLTEDAKSFSVKGKSAAIPQATIEISGRRVSDAV